MDDVNQVITEMENAIKNGEPFEHLRKKAHDMGMDYFTLFKIVRNAMNEYINKDVFVSNK